MSKRFSFLGYITDTLSENFPGDQRQPTLWPSEASAVVEREDGTKEVIGKCRRAIFLRYVADNYNYYDKYSYWKELVNLIKRDTVPVSPYMRWIWIQGELYEQYLVNKAKETGIFFSAQQAVYMKEWNVSGKIDIQILNPENSKISIVESKSVYGFGGNAVHGTDSQRKKNIMGKPKDSNIMQIALYQYHIQHKSDQSKFIGQYELDDGRLSYGSRDTGIFSEYIIKVDEEGKIFWSYNGPIFSEQENEYEVTVPAILKEYKYVQNCVDGGIIPDRDFDIKFSEAQIKKLYDAGELTKTNREAYEAIEARKAENIERETKGEKLKKELKPLDIGDWHCEWCQFKNICYNKDKQPNNL